ncbi:MAG: hypothetical protein HC902_13085 [Calothrix sp. SM1_5_4]|nr:hypothetical protein [Calothrix sp. SM1_5_4]
MLERLKLAQAGVPFDLVIGLDQLLLPEARAAFAWKELAVDSVDFHPEAAAMTDSKFVAFDWSPLSFVYRGGKGGPVPEKFDDLLRPELSKQFALQDPHVSTPGLQFFSLGEGLEGCRDGGVA